MFTLQPHLLAYDVQITPCCCISLYDDDEVSRLHESKNASHTITAVAYLAHMESLQSYLGSFSPSKTEPEGTKPHYKQSGLCRPAASVVKAAHQCRSKLYSLCSCCRLCLS